MPPQILLAFGILTCYTGQHPIIGGGSWSAGSCVLEFRDPLPLENWLIVGLKNNTVIGGRYPEGTKILALQFGDQVDLVQYNGETITPHWVDEPLPPEPLVDDPPVKLPSPKRASPSRKFWRRTLGKVK